MPDMEKLRAEIAVGWTVRIIDHDYINDSRDAAEVTAILDNGVRVTPARPWKSQGSTYRSMMMRWDGDRVVTGRKVDVYTTPAPHTGKARRMIKTFVFEPPRG